MFTTNSKNAQKTNMKFFSTLILNSGKNIREIFAKRFFGSNLVWETNLDAGLDKIKSSQRPGMIVCHKSWCEACRKLKPKFSTSREIETLSCGFVLISLMDDDLPKAKKFQPDGDYVPRILFVNPQGTVMVEIINEEGSSDYKYFYGEPSSIARSMKKVLAMYPLQGLAG